MTEPRRLVVSGTALLAVALAAVPVGQPARAAGIAAGTVINNVASATYSSGSGTKTVSSNTITIRVSELLDVAVAPVSGAPVAIGAGTAVLAFQVTNSGNGSEAFNLVANPTVPGNGFDAAVQAIVADSNGNGTYEPGVDTVITGGAALAALPADGSIRVFVVVAPPAGMTDAQTSQLRLSATAVTGSGNPGTVFAGKGDGGVDAVVGASRADRNALGALVASLATVSLAKTATIVDPFGGASPVPGATVTYVLTTHASGSGTASGVHVTDAIPTGTTYLPGTLSLNGTALSDALDGDAGTAGAAGIDVGLGALTGGSPDDTITFQVKIN